MHVKMQGCASCIGVLQTLCCLMQFKHCAVQRPLDDSVRQDLGAILHQAPIRVEGM